MVLGNGVYTGDGSLSLVVGGLTLEPYRWSSDWQVDAFTTSGSSGLLRHLPLTRRPPIRRTIAISIGLASEEFQNY